MSRFLPLISLFGLLFCGSAKAEELFSPSRVGLLVHADHKLTDKTKLAATFIPSGNLAAGLAPFAYLGGKLTVTDWLVVEPYAGWAFPTDEPLLSLTLNPHGDKVWAWTETDVQLVTGGGYVFVQAEYQFNDWLAAGVEGEGWGNWKDGSSWSTGGGPNVLLHYGQLGTDLAVQVRDNAGQVKPQFVMRFHLFL